MFLDLQYIQRHTPGLEAEMMPRSIKMECTKILKCLQWMSIEVMKVVNKLCCTNHDEVHKSEVDSPPFQNHKKYELL